MTSCGFCLEAPKAGSAALFGGGLHDGRAYIDRPFCHCAGNADSGRPYRYADINRRAGNRHGRACYRYDSAATAQKGEAEKKRKRIMFHVALSVDFLYAE